jgi:hypothetical protein
MTPQRKYPNKSDCLNRRRSNETRTTPTSIKASNAKSGGTGSAAAKIGIAGNVLFKLPHWHGTMGASTNLTSIPATGLRARSAPVDATACTARALETDCGLATRRRFDDESGRRKERQRIMPAISKELGKDRTDPFRLNGISAHIDQADDAQRRLVYFFQQFKNRTS